MTSSRIEMREMSRLYERLSKQVVATGSQIYHQLQRYMPSYWPLGDWHEEPWLWDLFEAAPTPQAVQKLRQAKVKAILKKHRIRRHKPLALLKDLQSQQPLTVAPGVCEAASAHIAMLLPILRSTHQQRRACEKRLEVLLTRPSPSSSEPDEDNVHHEAQLLLSLPGIGKHNGPVMLTEAASALQDRDYHGLRRLSGVAPVSIRTGGRHKKARVKMRRACNPRLRTAVHHWANTASQR